MKIIQSVFFIALLLLSSCDFEPKVFFEEESKPSLFPDYTDITIPFNIASLNFVVLEHQSSSFVKIEGVNSSFKLKGTNGRFHFPLKKWKKLLRTNKGTKLTITIYVKKNDSWIKYQPFYWEVAEEKIDPYLVYRLIEPTYANWNHMGIYQRCLENFEVSAVIKNSMTDDNCMNCHTFCMQNGEKMVFHMRKKNGGTYLINNDKIKKLSTTTPYTPSFFVYPAWHPSEKLIAFTVNDTHQSFYMSDNKRSEIYDSASDIQIYDVDKNEIFTSPLLSSESSLETYPAFSPDGKKLYFCTTEVRTNLPEEVSKLKYSLCSIDFDPEQQTFGQEVDTLVSSFKINKSAVFPKPSPDGRFLLFSVLEFGCFPCWSRDANIYVYSLTTNELYPLDSVNTTSSEGYSSWSSNNSWFVVSSRRLDNGFSRPFIAYMDNNGNASKAFLLPQEDPLVYKYSMKSFNLPELLYKRISIDPYKIREAAVGEDILQINVRGREKISIGKDQGQKIYNRVN